MKLTRLISDGCVFQHSKEIHIWGEAQADHRVGAELIRGEEKYGGDVAVDENGYFSLYLPALELDVKSRNEKRQDEEFLETNVGPDQGDVSGHDSKLTLIVTEYVAADTEIIDQVTIHDILLGNVFFCSGQSNMDLMIERVQDNYPGLVEDTHYENIRYFKIAEYTNFHGEQRDTHSGEWRSPQPDTLLDFSASAFFFAKNYYEQTGIPVGIIHASLGGSKISCWMSREMLADYPALLHIADRYADDEFVKNRIDQNMQNAVMWHRELDEKDIFSEYITDHDKKLTLSIDDMLAITENGQCSVEELTSADDLENVSDFLSAEKLDGTIDDIIATVESLEDDEGEDELHTGEAAVPGYFKDCELKNFIGVIYLMRKFEVSEDYTGEDFHLWMGTMVDSDTVYVNGERVGHTDYQYPPRKYEVPAGLLHTGINEICIRLTVENGEGRITPGKSISLWNDEHEIDLRGVWQYAIGARMGAVPPTDFINWKPTGLYNGMTYPCTQYPVGGVVWYQGESNTGEPFDYLELSAKQIAGYRKAWDDEDLPYVYVQIPNFTVDRHYSEEWPGLREKQRQIMEHVTGTQMVCAIDLGEDNDLHPMGKEPVGERIALAMLHLTYPEKDLEYCGPVVSKIENIKTTDPGCTMHLVLSHAEDGAFAVSDEAGNGEIRDFDMVDGTGKKNPCKAVINGDGIDLSCPLCEGEPQQILYCYRNTNDGALIYNTAGLPMAPFVMNI